MATAESGTCIVEGLNQKSLNNSMFLNKIYGFGLLKTLSFSLIRQWQGVLAVSQVTGPEESTIYATWVHFLFGSFPCGF